MLSTLYLLFELVVLPQTLESALKKALKGDLEDVVMALLKTPAQYDAQLLKLAMKVNTRTPALPQPSF